jgi:hypothetical protein
MPPRTLGSFIRPRRTEPTIWPTGSELSSAGAVGGWAGGGGGGALAVSGGGGVVGAAASGPPPASAPVACGVAAAVAPAAACRARGCGKDLGQLLCFGQQGA